MNNYLKTDVIPFIPVSDVTMAECIQLAEELGQEIAEKLNIPVYLYEEVAKNPAYRNLPNIRKWEYEGLKVEIAKPERCPDYGPTRMHPKAGATVVGAWQFLIAYNINLGTSDVSIAKKIANCIREPRELCQVDIESQRKARVSLCLCAGS